MSEDTERLSRDEMVERAKAKWELMRREALPNLGTFSEFYIPTMTCAEGLAPLYAVFDRIFAGEQVFALVEGPPRQGKSTNVFTAFARHLTKYPHHLIGYGAYNQTFANAQSRLARSISEKCGVWSHEMVGQQSSRFDPAQSVAHWQTAAGGGAKFVGRGGSALGSGFNLGVVDDPIKNPDEAESEIILDKAWEWIIGSIFNRLEPNGSFLCTHQRWNDEDPIGRFKKQIELGYPDAPPELRDKMAAAQWTVVTLKAIIDEGTPHARPLMPNRFDMLALTRIRLTIGEFYWWAQYMQDPRPRGGRMFPEQYASWIAWVESNGETHGIMVDGEWIPVPSTLQTKRVFLVFGADTATSDSLNADSTALALGAFYYEYDPQTKRDELMGEVLRVWDEKLKSPDVVNYIARKCGSLPGAAIAYETQSVGKAQMQFLAVQHPELVVQGVTTSSSKRIRATPAANMANRGRLRLPMIGAWVGATKAQLTRFTGAEGKRDDKVDAIAHMVNLAMKLPRPGVAFEGDERGEFGREGKTTGDDNGSLYGDE